MSNDIVPAWPPSGALRERDGADAADPRIARAEQRLAMLRELSDLGMAMTRRLARRALAAVWPFQAVPARLMARAAAWLRGSPRHWNGHDHVPETGFPGPYRPFHTGARFSANAAGPSFASSLSRQAA
jgi:hypothetical protein